MATTTRPVKRSSKRKPSRPVASDATRAKLLEVATEVFADRGFYATTVREISRRAGANIAAVNYHFRDKMGLYTEVLRGAVRPVGENIAQTAFEQGMSPEQMLRAAIKVWLTRLYGTGRPAVPFRLMRHELAQPTPALAQVINEVMRPNYDRLRAVIGALLSLPPDHEKVRFCTHSVMGQVVFYPQAAPVLSILWPQFKMTPEQVDRIADHIADFSLAYLRSQRTK